MRHRLAKGGAPSAYSPFKVAIDLVATRLRCLLNSLDARVALSTAPRTRSNTNRRRFFYSNRFVRNARPMPVESNSQIKILRNAFIVSRSRHDQLAVQLSRVVFDYRQLGSHL